MFKSISKQQVDVRKTLSKFFDLKRECVSRLRYLKSLIESKDLHDAREFLNNHYSNIYTVFYETFLQTDAAKFRGKFNKEDVDLLLFIFEKILILLPELIERKWQFNSILFIFKKFLHQNNMLWIRKEGIRLFLIFYQILGENIVKSNPHVELLYASLIPGIVTDLNRVNQLSNLSEYYKNIEQQMSSPVQPFYNEPFITPVDYSSIGNISIDPKKDSNILLFTNCVLDYSITQCGKVYWREYRDRRHLRSFEFLFSSFARIYLPYIFHRMASVNSENEWPVYNVRNSISIYHLPDELPLLRKYNEYAHFYNQNHSMYINIEVKVAIIHWFARHLLGPDKMLDPSNGSSTLTPQSSSTVESNLSKYSSHSNSHQSLSSGSSINMISGSSGMMYPPTSYGFDSHSHETSVFESEMICSLLNSKRIYVDLVFSLFNEAFLMPFNERLNALMRNVLKVYKQWIYKEIDTPLPLFLAEPSSYSNSASSSVSSMSTSSSKTKFNDETVCVGFNSLLNIFIKSSANVFLLEVPSEERSALDFQVDVCKRVLNIYRYMVMKVDMDKSVWESLVQILIQITRCIISKEIPKKRDDTLGGRLAPALFQTLIVTWIKANLNVQLSMVLWGKFHELVSSLTRWEELITEWSNTMHILNRIMSRYVFNINLNELPLEKMLTDRKRKIRDASMKTLNNPNLMNNSQGINFTMNNATHQTVTVQTSNGDSDRVLVRTNSETNRQTKQSVQRFFSTNESSYAENLYDPRVRGSIQNARNYLNGISFNSIKRHRDCHLHSHERNLYRSLSDSCLVLSVQHSLCGIRSKNFRKRCYKPRRQSRLTPLKRNLKNMPMIDDEIDEEENCTLVDVDASYDGDVDLSDNDSSLDLIDDSFNEYLLSIYQRQRILYRFHSMEDLFLPTSRHWSTLSDNSSIGAECNSFRDTPLAFDTTSAASTCSSSVAEQMCIGGYTKQNPSESNIQSNRPVLMGGNYKGWNAEISIMLWRRMLGILGDLNNIEDPAIHQLAFKCLASLTDDLIKIKDNISYLNGTNHDNHGMDGNSVLQPSLHYFTAWLFQATQLPKEYKEGKLLAYKLLCIIALHRGERELNRDFLILFYLTIKHALSTLDLELTCTIIRYCALKFFSSALPGSSCLLFDFISASNMIVSSLDVSQQTARVEVINLLGSLIGFFDIFSNVQILRLNSPTELSLEPYKELKEHVLEILIIASKREQNGLGRAIAFCSLGICLYKEFLRGTDYHRLKEIISILIAGTRISIRRPKSNAVSPTTTSSSTSNTTTTTYATNDINSKFNNRILCRVACDMLKLQSDHAVYLTEKYPDIVRRIIEGLCHTLSLHVDVLQQQETYRDFKNLLLTIMFCIAHWCMAVNKDFLANTFVSREYPIFVEDNLNKYPDDPSNPPKGPRMTLLNLVISIFTTVADLNNHILKHRRNVDYTMVDQASFGDMDTIDYTITNATLLNAKGDTSVSHSPNIMSNVNDINTVKKAAHLILLHFLNFMGHFPISKLRTVSLCALVNENDDNPFVQQNEKVDYEALCAPNVLMFVVNNTSLMSFIELPPEAVESTIISKLSTSKNALNVIKAKPIRIIIRNLLGKFCWDCVMLTSPVFADRKMFPKQSINIDEPLTGMNRMNINSTEDNENDFDDNNYSKDSLAMLVNQIHNVSPECRSVEKNDFLQTLNQLPDAKDTVALLTNQHYQESTFIEEKRLKPNQRKQFCSSERLNGEHSIEHSTNDTNLDSICSSLNSSLSSTSIDPAIAFQYCRQMMEQFGFLSWDKRANIELISKNQSTIRELRHLDSQRCRDKHKIAVIYVGAGQETRESILSNKSGSRAFEEFVGRLGWEVNLATHVGFMGGLESNLSTGRTAPYFADSFNEVIFHVSTRLEPTSIDGNSLNQPLEKQQLMNKKMRHLGNDEIHIVWSEHFKEYRRSILATDFCDALIVIYPLPVQTYPNLYRIQISRKQEVSFFGPLFNGAVVHRDELASLVRATALNASRAKRLHMTAYKPFFEERFDSIHKFATIYKNQTTFEEYATKIYSPRYDLLSQIDSGFITEDISHNISTGTGFISIENFVRSTNGLISSPSNADSLSISSTGGTSSSYNMSDISHPSHYYQQQANQQQYGYQTTQMPTSSSSSSMRGSRPTSRNSFTQK